MTTTTSSRTITGYRQNALRRAQAELQRFYGKDLRGVNMSRISGDQVKIRAYPGLESCDMAAVAHHMVTVTGSAVTRSELAEAERVKLSGREIIEDAAAGEATRLGLGTKYLLTPQRIVEALMLHNLKEPGKFIPIPLSPNDLAPLSLGVRHKLQFIYDLIKLAGAPQSGPALNPGEVVKSQFSLTVLNEETELPILREIARHDHFGLAPERTLFVVQEKGLGMSLDGNGRLFFDPASEFRLWNHGDMKTQQTLDHKVFWVRINSSTGEMERRFLTAEQVENIFAAASNLISYPIEDLDYLTGSINLTSLAVALRLGRDGYRMTMEAVAQGTPPQKGGFFTFDPARDRVVCVESDCGGEVIRESDPFSLASIAYLNKNFNMFPSPVEAFRVLARQSMPQHLTAKGGYLYPQSVQGDQNLELATAVIQWDPVTSIRNLKVLSHGGPTLLAMQSQDRQPGFLDLARQYRLI